jgi:hypothetical protein
MHAEHPKTLACNVAALAEFGYLKDFPRAVVQASITTSWFVLVYPHSFFENFVEHICSESSSVPYFVPIFSIQGSRLSNIYNKPALEKFTYMSRSRRLKLTLRSC